jgi:hypothetical protein
VTKEHAALALPDGDFSDMVMEESTHMEARKIAALALVLSVQVEKETDASFQRELTRKEGKN